VIVASNPDMTGAARLAARGALRIGAGLVGIIGPAAATAINAANVTSEMTASYENKQEFIDFISDPRRNAILLGPGNGISDSTRDNVLAALGLGKSCVLDADALSVFRDDPDTLFEALSENCLLTPHSGEFARLFGNPSDNSGSKLAQTREAAKRCGATVLFKGADTVIAAPDGRAVINTNAPPELATAGAGDVLAGLAIGLIAQGLDSFTAASAAAWLHGETARAFGPGLISEDLNEMLPGVLRDLKARR
jgi:NAD(P)H-hydrate epimerase